MDCYRRNHIVSWFQSRMNPQFCPYEWLFWHLLHNRLPPNQQHHRQTFPNEYQDLCDYVRLLKLHPEYFQYLIINKNTSKINEISATFQNVTKKMLIKKNLVYPFAVWHRHQPNSQQLIDQFLFLDQFVRGHHAMEVVRQCVQQNQNAIDEWSNRQMFVAFVYLFELKWTVWRSIKIEDSVFKISLANTYQQWLWNVEEQLEHNRR